MGNTQKSQNTNKNPEINNMPTYPIVNTQSNMDQNVFKSQDSYFKIKQYLKTMYKNNFVSLAFEDLSAFYIQMAWKQHVIQKYRKDNRGMIDLIYTSLDKNPNVTSRTDRMFVLLQNKKYQYRCYDVFKYKNLKFIIEECGGYEKLPAIFINDFFIGSENEFQELNDLNLVSSILNKEYTRRCLMCNVVRKDKSLEICPFCYKKYTFFAKSDELINVQANRFIQ